MQFPYRKEKMSYNNFRESRLRFSDSLNGQRWIFLRKGLDDFRDGFPPSSDNMIVSSKRLLVSQGPEILFKSKAGYNDYQRETQTPQEVQDHMEDKQMKVTGCKKLVHSKEPLGKKACTSLSKVTEGGKKATQSHLAPLHEHTKRVTKHFCDWVMSLEPKSETRNLVSDSQLCCVMSTRAQSFEMVAGTAVLMKMHFRVCFHSSSESKEAGLLTPFCAVKLNDGQAEQSGKTGDFTSQVCLSGVLYHLGCLPCQVKVLYQPKREKIRYGAWYLDPKTWRKEIVNKPLEASEETINRIRNAKHHLSEKEMEVPQLHSTQAFKEFLERKGYQKPRGRREHFFSPGMTRPHLLLFYCPHLSVTSLRSSKHVVVHSCLDHVLCFDFLFPECLL
nr:protein FAM47E [Anas platyrhynchos]